MNKSKGDDNDAIIERYNKNAYGLRAYNATDKFSVFMDEIEGELVMGPFKVAMRRLIKERYDKLNALDAKYIAQYKLEKGDWVHFDDFTKDYAINGEASQKDSKGTYIAVIDEIGKYIHVCRNAEWIHEEGVAVELLKTLVLLWVLRVSFQMNNVYVDLHKKTLWIIDLSQTSSEEVDAKRKESSLFFLARDPEKKCKFPQHMKGYYQTVANILKKLRVTDLSNTEKARLKEGIALLEKHGSEDYSGSSEEYNVAPGSFLYGVPTEKKGEMKSERDNAITFSGYPFKTALNWLQIYIRQADNERAVMMAVELYHIKNAPGDFANTHYLSFIKKLKQIAASDIGIANYHFALAVIDFLNRYEENVTYVEVISLVIAMCDSPKTSTPYDLYIFFRENKEWEKCGREGRKLGLLLDEDSASRYEMGNGNAVVREIESTGLKDDNAIRSIYNLYEAIKGQKEIKIYGEKGKVRETLQGKRVDVAMAALAYLLTLKAKMKNSALEYVDREGKKHTGSGSSILVWQMIEKITVEETNDKFSIAINILRYAYYKDIHHSYDFIILAVAAALEGLSYEPYPLRFEEADEMSYYLPAEREVKDNFGNKQFKNKDKDYLANEQIPEKWINVHRAIQACK